MCDSLYGEQPMKNEGNYVKNMFNPEIMHYKHNTNPQKGWMTSETDTYALFNPNFVEARTGLERLSGRQKTDTGEISDASGMYDPQDGKWWFNGKTDNAKYINGLEDNGFKLEQNGVAYDVSPETVAMIKATLPAYGSSMNKNAIKAEIAKNIGGLYEDQYKKTGWRGAVDGFRGYNTRIQQDLNAMYQMAMADIQSGDPKRIARGRSMMSTVATTQYAYNAAQPQVSARMGREWRRTVDNAKGFARNNWWWMAPAGGLALYGVYNLFNRFTGAPRQTQQMQQLTASPIQISGASMLPDGWTTGVQLQKPSLPAASPGTGASSVSIPRVANPSVGNFDSGSDDL